MKPDDQDSQGPWRPSAVLKGAVLGIFVAVLILFPGALAGGREAPLVSDKEVVGILLLCPAIGAALAALVDWFRRWF